MGASRCEKPLPFRQGYRLAIGKYTEALRLCPDYAEAYVYRALAQHLLRPIWKRMLFGPCRRALADARRARELQPDTPRLYHLVAMVFPPDEQAEVLREALHRFPDSEYEALLRYALGRALWDGGDFAACARETEAALDQGSAIEPFGLSRQQLCSAYEALGDYVRAAQAYQDRLDLHHGPPAAQPGQVDPALPAELAATGPDAGELLDELRMQAIGGLVRCRMRSEDFSGARAATEVWRPYLPVDRVPINLAVLEVLEGGAPSDLDTLLPAVAACAAQDDYYGFFAGVLFAHAGDRRNAARYLRRFLKGSRARAKIWGAQEQWERTQAERLLAR